MKSTTVGLAECKVSRKPDESLSILGLGSSIGLFVFDPETRTGAVAHVMLPAGRDMAATPAKYGETAVTHVLEQLSNHGASTTNLRIAVFGGAQMMTAGPTALLEVGKNNIAAIQASLGRAGLAPTLQDVGGCKGRTVQLAVGTGFITVRVLSHPDRVYADLVGPEDSE